MPTSISWTNETWNPVTGCSKVSEGCRHCYAETLSLKNGWSHKPWTAQNADDNIIFHPDRLGKPAAWKTPRMVFVNSMSDLFHPLVIDHQIAQIFQVMASCPQHTFQILTKRPERATSWPGRWPDNVWMGTSVEDAKSKYRLDALRRCPASIKFVSFEPLIGSVGAIDLSGFQWAIVGGESGSVFRPMDHAWAREIRNQCAEQRVAFFFKQSASVRPGTNPRLTEADGSQTEWHQYPGECPAVPDTKQLSLFN